MLVCWSHSHLGVASSHEYVRSWRGDCQVILSVSKYRSYGLQYFTTIVTKGNSRVGIDKVVARVQLHFSIPVSLKDVSLSGSAKEPRRITKVFRSKGYLEVQGYITLNCTYLVCIWYLMTFTDNIIWTFIGFLSWHIATVMVVGWTVALSRGYRVGHWVISLYPWLSSGSVISILSSSHAETFNLSPFLWSI